MEKVFNAPKSQSIITNTNTKILLSQFVITKVQETELKDKIPSAKLIEDLLIEELNKKSIAPNDHFPDSNTRNLDIIMYALDHLKEFFRYKMFNSLDGKDIKFAANFFKHAHYKQGEYIFCYHEESDKFFGIIKGLVGIRGIKWTTNPDFISFYKKSNPELDDLLYQEGLLNDKKLQFLIQNDHSFYDHYFHKNILKTVDEHKDENQLRYELEFEKVVFSSGMCLGEWGIIDNIPRTASVYCKEDTDVFYCEKEPFMKYLSMCFLRSTSGKKLFLNQLLPGLAKFFVNIVPLFFHKNNLIYSQFDYADYLYIVYQGECSYVHIDRPKSRDDILSRKNEWKKLYIIEKGSILGLESLQYNTASNLNTNTDSMSKKNNPARGCCQYNLIASKDFTAIYRININMLTELGYNYREYLRKIYMIHDKKLCNAKAKLNAIKKKMQAHDHRKLFSNDDINQCADLALEKVNKQAKKMIQNRNLKRLKAFKVFPSTLTQRNNNTIDNNNYNKLLIGKRLLTSTVNRQQMRPMSSFNPELNTMRSTMTEMKTIGTNPLSSQRDHHNKERSSLRTKETIIVHQKQQIKDIEKRYRKNTSISPNNTNYQSELLITLQNQPCTFTTPNKFKAKKMLQIPNSGTRKPKCLNIRHQLILDEKQKEEDVMWHNSRNIHKKNTEYSYYNSGFYEMPLITDILNKSSKII